MRSAFFAIGVMLVASMAAAQGGSGALESARLDIDAGRYQAADERLERVIETASGETLREAVFLQAGLQTSVPQAEERYRRIIDDDPQSEWAKLAYLELAKVRYAVGDYQSAYQMLVDSRACDVSAEACLFQGLSAIRLSRFDDARRPLERIRRGKLRTWAYLSLADAESGMNRSGDACRRYEALAGTMISPTALYRYAECLEDDGDVNAATGEYREVIRSFPDTPEAVLAAEKLSVLSKPAPEALPDEPPPADDHAGVDVLESGFTLQFGSFRDRENAIKLAAKIKSVFPGVRIDSELIRFREHHRVRYGYFRTREEAQAMGKQIAGEMNEDFSIMSLP